MSIRKSCLVVVVLVGLAPGLARAADEYAVDPVHSSITFMISHLGLTYIHGRFNEFSGSLTVDRDDPARSSFALNIKVESVDTNNKKRDEHLRAPDFFNVKEFPTLSFQSKSVKAVADGYEVTGELGLHGVKKPVTFVLKGGKTAEFPPGSKMQRIGFTAGLVIKRSEFGMKTALDTLGDEVHISIGLEGVKK